MPILSHPLMDAIFGIEDLKLYINYLPQDDDLLKEIIPHVTAALPGILDQFYLKVVDNAVGQAVLANAGSNIETLKMKLRTWILEMLQNPLNATFASQQNTVGIIHLKINLPHSMVILAGNLIRTSLENIIFCHFRSRGADLSRALAAMNKRLDISLALLLNSYNEDRIRMVREKLEMENANMITLGRMSASIAHEIKNPLAGISGAIQVLRDRLQNDPEITEVFDNVLAEIRRLGATVTDLLDFARPLRLSLTQIPLVEVINNATAVLENDPLFRKIAITFEDATAGTLVRVDAVRLMTVFQNLIINAAQAMEGEGRVLIRSRFSKGFVEVDIADTGPGVDPLFRDHLFEPFTTSKIHGTGLGLAICRKVVQSHGGDISLVPAVQGACFRLTLKQVK